MAVRTSRSRRKGMTIGIPSRIWGILVLCSDVVGGLINCEGVRDEYVDPVTHVPHRCRGICGRKEWGYVQRCKAYCREFHECWQKSIKTTDIQHEKSSKVSNSLSTTTSLPEEAQTNVGKGAALPVSIQVAVAVTALGLVAIILFMALLCYIYISRKCQRKVRGKSNDEEEGTLEMVTLTDLQVEVANRGGLNSCEVEERHEYVQSSLDRKDKDEHVLSQCSWASRGRIQDASSTHINSDAVPDDHDVRMRDNIASSTPIERLELTIQTDDVTRDSVLETRLGERSRNGSKSHTL